MEKIKVVNKINTVEQVREIAASITEKLALELVHVEAVGTGNKKTIRIYIDKEAGILHEDCSAVSHGIEEILDSKDLISDAYILEVSSPGIERGLYSLADFEKFTNNSAKVKTDAAINGQRNFRGKIIGVEGEEVIFDDKTNGRVQIPYALVKKANLEFDLEGELQAAKKSKS